MLRYRTAFIHAGIGAVTAAATLAICVVLFGTFNEFQMKVLITTLVIGYYSFTAAATFGDGKEYLVLGTIGSVVAAFGLLATLPSVWIWSYDAPGKLIFSIGVIAFAFAHGTLNYRLSSSSMASVTCMAMANLMVTVVSVMLLIIIFGKSDLDALFMKFLIVFGILDVALTVINFMVAKMSQLKTSTA